MRSIITLAAFLFLGTPLGAQLPAAATTAPATYFEFQVEVPVRPVQGRVQPAYPSLLRSSGSEGEVRVQYVVDTLGRADTSTFKVLRSTHELFSAAVREALPRMRFHPAEVGGRKVRQVVAEKFTFTPPR